MSNAFLFVFDGFADRDRIAFSPGNEEERPSLRALRRLLLFHLEVLGSGRFTQRFKSEQGYLFLVAGSVRSTVDGFSLVGDYFSKNRF